MSRRENSTGSIYFRAMPDPLPGAARCLDATAVNAALRRMARSGQAPWLHGEVARRMAQRLEVVLLKPSRVIDWWGALGAGGALLDKAYPKAQRIVVEPTAAWLQHSRSAAHRPWWSAARWGGPAVETIADEDAATLAPGVQLVWANMMLHAVVDPPALFARWEQLLAVDGFVMFSCLGPGTLRELRALYARLGWPAATPGFIDMHDLGDMLVRSGFADPVMDQETLVLHWESPGALLAELRSLGGNTAPGRFAGLRTPGWQRALESELSALAGPDGRIAMSFEVAYGHAFKAAPRLRADAPTTVSLTDMRALVRSSHDKGRAGRTLR